MEKLKRELLKKEFVNSLDDLERHKGFSLTSNDLDHQNDSLQLVVLKKSDEFIISDDHLVEGELFLMGRDFDSEYKEKVLSYARNVGILIDIKNNNEITSGPVSREDATKEISRFNNFLKLVFENIKLK